MFQCVDESGEDFCVSKQDKCDKANIQEQCQKTCGLCPEAETTVPASTTTEGSTGASITSTVGEETSTADGGSSTTTNGEGSTTPSGETTAAPVSEIYCNYCI